MSSVLYQQQKQQVDWPLAEYSQYVHAGGLQWHVQVLGEGPIVCLLHGTGSSTHSWRVLARSLSSHYCVVMCDLPGHGLSALPVSSRMSLTGMSALVTALFTKMDISPDFIVGHSAGAAIACQLVLDKCMNPQCVVSINGALIPFTGLAGQLFSPLAQLMASSSVIPNLVRWRAIDGDITTRLLHDTGSVIDAEGCAYYKRLLSDKKHVSGALKMMAHWNLHEFARRLPTMSTPLHLVTGSNDKTVPPRQGIELNHKLVFTTLTDMPALGHLAHEEAPVLFDALLRELFRNSNDARTSNEATTSKREQKI